MSGYTQEPFSKTDGGNTKNVYTQSNSCENLIWDVKTIVSPKSHIKEVKSEIIMNIDYMCKLCDKMLSIKTFKRHMRCHNEKLKSFNCTNCAKMFSDRTGLKRHWRTHTGYKPFSCTQCDKIFSDTGNLSKHINKHTGEKPFPCGLCQKSFSQASNLKTHLKTHSKVKPYSCRHCGISFSTKYGCQGHEMAIHEGVQTVSCHICGKIVKQNKQLRRHMAAHEIQTIMAV